MAMTPAMESIFANAQQNAASLIEVAAWDGYVDGL